ncbi:hypothetical protein EYF80_035587 [Liparis tanakae]|uniref:Uncharacterized protein n=1 Tax=Liparis tanakae TaxID=230148 RepID=A0A4Z2GLY2_9TELE|nr:hypothetical protein EYF80_035587 [Liparis tanakae]
METFRPRGDPGLEVGLVLLHLHHEVVQVDELRADGQAAEGGLVEDLVEAVVVLDQLGQGALRHGQEVESLPVWISSTQEWGLVSRTPSFWGSVFRMLWMFISRMSSNLGHSSSSTASQYLRTGEEDTPTDEEDTPTGEEDTPTDEENTPI